MNRKLAVALAAAVVVVGPSLAACTPSRAPAKPTLLIYGDSLTVSSEGAVDYLYGAAYRIVFQARNGTAACDWAPVAAADRIAFHPSRVVLAFTGNAATCVEADRMRGGLTGVVANYTQAVTTMRTAFADLPMSVVAAPAMATQPVETFYPDNGAPALNDAYRALCAQYGMRYNDLADQDLTPGHVFELERPTFYDGPQTVVRKADGVHLTPAGAVWYGAALGA